MNELINKGCGCEFVGDMSKWPIPGSPAWVVIEAIDMPMIKMKNRWHGPSFWINASQIVKIWEEPHLTPTPC